MRYRRAVVLAEPAAAPGAALSALRSVAAGIERVVVARLWDARVFWKRGSGGHPGADELAALEAWRAAAAAIAPSAEVRYGPALSAHALVDLALYEDADLLVAGARSLDTGPMLEEAAERLGIALLLPGRDGRGSPVNHVLCAAMDRRSQAALIGFLREHGEPSLRISVAGPPDIPRGELDAALQVVGVPCQVQLLPRTVSSLRSAVDAARASAVDLLVFSLAPIHLLLAYPWPAPVLLVPSGPPPAQRARPLDVADVAELGGRISIRVDEVTAGGALTPAASAPLAFLSEGRTVATAITSASGEVELRAEVAPSWLGAVRVDDDGSPDALMAMAQRFAVVRPGERAILLIDAELPVERLEAARDLARDGGLEPLAVRLRPATGAAALRERLRTAGLTARVLDARALLDEGDALDVAEANDPVRLRRVAGRLRAAGFPIASVLDRTLGTPEAACETKAPPIEGNRVEVELDNRRARLWLLEAIASSSRSIEMQVYMALDDEVGRAVVGELAGAASRGVAVRFLVDSLHGLHGSYGAENPLLSRLASVPGVEVRVSRPLTGAPSMMDLKQRDHRKLVVVDHQLALVGGRNLSHEYYMGFEEVSLDAATPWRMVPWLDAGARIEGPAVAAIAAPFLEAWVDAGGSPFRIDAPAPAGSAAARVVVHRGLRDAHTLEAYLELIESAKSRVYAVNGFPHALEVQHALLRALERGVSVRALTGHLTPTHGGIQFPGPWAAARAAATEFVHSRLDPLLEQGGEVYLFAAPEHPGWEAGLGAVQPHVHAKLMSVDGLRCAVGSANFDVTSSYWESELTVVVEDAEVVAGLERRLDELIATSTRVDSADPLWRERARGRRWMHRWPGVLGL